MTDCTHLLQQMKLVYIRLMFVVHGAYYYPRQEVFRSVVFVCLLCLFVGLLIRLVGWFVRSLTFVGAENGWRC